MRWPHEFLFSMNLATVVVWASEERLPSVLLNVLGNAVERYLIPVLRKLSFTGNSRPAGYLFYFAMCLLLGLSIFSRAPTLSLSLGVEVSGACFGWSSQRRKFSHKLFVPSQPLGNLGYPNSLAVGGDVLRRLGSCLSISEQRIPPVPGILLLATHFGVWAWVSGGFLFPILGFLSSLTWGLYMRLWPTVRPQPEVATQ